MDVGMVGLGRMGSNMVRRLLAHGHRCVAYDVDPASVQALAEEGAAGAGSLDELVAALPPPRPVWVMVPAGPATGAVVRELGDRLQPGDVVIDGGNSFFKDDVAHAGLLSAKGIHFVDVGTSGGVWGLERGYSLMIGGEAAVVRRLDPLFRSLAPGRGSVPRTPGREASQGTAEEGYVHCGPAGAGHFVKMVHNGIEYGLMQAYAEGFDLLHAAARAQPEYRYELNLADIAEVWRRGSVVASWLLDLTATALQDDPSLERYTGTVQDSGEGRWTVQTAIEQAVPVNVLAAALFGRFRSRQDHTFGEKLLSAMREQFGGHVERRHEP